MDGGMMGYNLDPNLLVNALGNNNKDCNDGMLGGQGGLLWIFLLLLFGGNGFGRNNNNLANDAVITGQVEAAISKAQAAGCSDKLILEAISGNKEAISNLAIGTGSNFAQVDNALRGLEKGICDLGFKTSQETASVIAQITAGDAALSRQLSDCCCQTQRSIDVVRYDMANGFNEISHKIDKCCSETQQFVDKKIDAAQAENRAGFQAIRDYMVTEKMEALQTELQSAQFQLSQNAQTRAIEDYIKKIAVVTCPNGN